MLAKSADERPDAETVVAVLTAAGFRPGTAPKSLAGRGISEGDEELIEARAPAIGKSSRVSTEPAVTASSGDGLSPKTVMIALAALVLLLAGVVFLLVGLVAYVMRGAL